MKSLHQIIAITLSVLVVACGGGGSSDDNIVTPTPTPTPTTPTPTPTPVDNPNTPNIIGFDFNLNEGDFWEYQWDYYTSSVYSGGGSSKTYSGLFRVTLGSPSVVGELTAYPLIISGNNRQDINNVTPFITPRWTHIAIHDNKILMSSDGATFETVFDANTGYAIGFGFFLELSTDNLFEITSGTINNDYISGDAYVLADSASESNCQYFPEYGTICGADVTLDYTRIRREYYQESIGPVGYYYHFSSSSGGTFDSYHTTNTINIGLIASSLRGDVVDYTLEAEPNNSPETASLISYASLPITVKGDFNTQGDKDVTLPENYVTNHYLYLNDRDENEPNNTLSGSESIPLNTAVHGNISSNDTGEHHEFSIPGYNISTTIEDWYHFSMSETRAIEARLEFYGAPDGVDMDLFLFDDSGSIVEYAINENNAADGSDDMEYIWTTQAMGDYYIGVDIWPDASDSSVTSASYTLSLNHASHDGQPAASSQVVIRDYYKINIQSPVGLSITSTPSLGLFLTESDGETVIASAPNSVDDTTTQTVLNTPTLEPGEYLLAIGSQAYHWASENMDIDTYEVTIDAAH